ncbi:S66 peptidase family protein [Duganella guangzhouensis]|nr:LD-carboxypeptidase [Duganella guangzhouensis]
MPSLSRKFTVAVIAPASPPSLSGLDTGIATLKAWGMDVLEGRHLRKQFSHHAMSVAERTEDLIWALTAPEVDVVWLARGGYGCMQCLPFLPAELPTDRIVIGFSDATSLFGALSQRGYRNLIHGPMVAFLADETDELSKSALLALLNGQARPHLVGEHLCGPQSEITAPLVGGNLAVLASLAGTPWIHSTKGAIVLLEDIAEHAYRMDRTITQLANSGFFDGVKGIALGEFIRCILPRDATFTLDEMFRNLFAPLNVPVIKDVGVGHGTRNIAWKMGEQVTLRDGSLHFAREE